jgi:glycosyltransferase involved in cell wall biosynthesis
MANRVTQMTRRALPWDTIKDELQQATATVDIVIPAFNEGSCIEGLLNDVVMAKQDNWFEIQHIYVISDASTDQTDDIVQQVATTDRRVKLIRKQERKGVQDSKNLAFSVTSADVLVFIDADVRLASEHSIPKLVQYFRDGTTALVQGGLVRTRPVLSLNAAKQAAYFDWILVDTIRKQKDMSWWSIDGRVMALSRDFYQHLSLPHSLADDQFIFYSCIQQRRKFVWAEDAIFYYGPPESIADFSHQWSRYFFYTNKSHQYFGKDLIGKDMNVSGLWRTIMSSIIRHPFYGLMWVMCYGISKVEFILRVNFGEYERGFFGTSSKPLTIQAMGRWTNWEYTSEYKVNQKDEREHEASQQRID